MIFETPLYHKHYNSEKKNFAFSPRSVIMTFEAAYAPHTFQFRKNLHFPRPVYLKFLFDSHSTVVVPTNSINWLHLTQCCQCAVGTAFCVLLTYKSWLKWSLNKQAETNAKATETAIITGLVTVSEQACQVRLPAAHSPVASAQWRHFLAELLLSQPEVNSGKQNILPLVFPRTTPTQYLTSCSFHISFHDFLTSPPSPKLPLPRYVLRIPPTWSYSTSLSQHFNEHSTLNMQIKLAENRLKLTEQNGVMKCMTWQLSLPHITAFLSFSMFNRQEQTLIH